MKIEDNFLEQRVFDELQNVIMGGEFIWCYSNHIDFEDKKKFMFVHLFYADGVPCSQFLENMFPILKTINALSMWQIKANLLTRTLNIVENAFHVDIGVMSKEKIKQWTTSIFYMGTNNGYTKFEDGTKVESVANRMVTFPANMKHTGTSCTDEKRRIVINFNYFEH